MTTIELIKVDPFFTKLPYTLHARIEEDGDKITDLQFKAFYNKIKYKR